MSLPTSDTALSVDSDSHTASARDPVEALASEVAELLALAWQQGERPTAEDFLAHHPALAERPQAALRVVYEEICQRRDAGLPVDPQSLVRRYPAWRSELEMLLACDDLVGPMVEATRFPEVGEELGDFRLIAELGKGALGRTYLAAQPALADRPIALKVMPRDQVEHLSLARLQHTHIMPLYSVQDIPERGLHAMAMPYLGGASLQGILDRLRQTPVERRQGRDLVAAIDALQLPVPIRLPTEGPSRRFLGRVSYIEAVCWLGLHLAEALQHAHERGLVHMDVKPANVLLAADGQPMLLDFHLARCPIQAGEPPPANLGGTPGFLAPEQERAMQAVRHGRVVPCPVDGRCDLYGLGYLLYLLLGGPTTVSGPHPPLSRYNRRVSVGLSDIIQKCLAADPDQRYRDAATLADDLRRHLADLPLKGAPNRSLSERFHKWRRRQPHALGLLLVRAGLLGFLVVAGLMVSGVFSHQRQLADRAWLALDQGRKQLAHDDPVSASSTLSSGLELISGLPSHATLRHDLAETLQRAERRAGRVNCTPSPSRSGRSSTWNRCRPGRSPRLCSSRSTPSGSTGGRSST